MNVTQQVSDATSERAATAELNAAIKSELQCKLNLLQTELDEERSAFLHAKSDWQQEREEFAEAVSQLRAERGTCDEMKFVHETQLSQLGREMEERDRVSTDRGLQLEKELEAVREALREKEEELEVAEREKCELELHCGVQADLMSRLEEQFAKCESDTFAQLKEDLQLRCDEQNQVIISLEERLQRESDASAQLKLELEAAAELRLSSLEALSTEFSATLATLEQENETRCNVIAELKAAFESYRVESEEVKCSFRAADSY